LIVITSGETASTFAVSFFFSAKLFRLTLDIIWTVCTQS